MTITVENCTSDGNGMGNIRINGVNYDSFEEAEAAGVINTEGNAPERKRKGKGNSVDRTRAAAGAKPLPYKIDRKHVRALRGKKYRVVGRPGTREAAKRLAKAGKLPFDRSMFSAEGFNEYVRMIGYMDADLREIFNRRIADRAPSA